MAPSRPLEVVSFLIAGTIGGATLFVVGYNSLVLGTDGAFWETVGFYLSWIAFFVSFLSPFAVFRFLGATRQSRAGEQLMRVGAYVFTVVFLFVLGLVGVFVLAPLGIDTAVEAIAFLDGVSGFIWSGIGGVLLVRRRGRRS